MNGDAAPLPIVRSVERRTPRNGPGAPGSMSADDRRALIVEIAIRHALRTRGIALPPLSPPAQSISGRRR